MSRQDRLDQMLNSSATSKRREIKIDQLETDDAIIDNKQSFDGNKQPHMLKTKGQTTIDDKVQLMGTRISHSVEKVQKNVQAAVQAAFDRIRGIVTRAKARFSRAIPRSRNRVHQVVNQAVAKVKSLNSIEAIKTTARELGQKIKDGEVLKYFKSTKEFVKLLEPIQRRYRELVRKMRGQASSMQAKPESKLWLELTGMTKAEIQAKTAQEMRFIMVNSSFNSNSAKDAIN